MCLNEDPAQLKLEGKRKKEKRQQEWLCVCVQLCVTREMHVCEE